MSSCRRWNKSTYGKKRWTKGERLRLILILTVLLVAFFLILEWRFAPVITVVAEKESHNMAVEVIESAVLRQITSNDDYTDYRNLVHIERDDDNRITMMVPNTMLINTLKSSVILDIERSFSDISERKFTIPFGTITGSTILSAVGPNLRFSIETAASPRVEIIDEFTEAGINQTKHSISMVISAEITVIAPFSTKTQEVSTTVLIAEGIVVGYTPNVYMNIEQ